MLNVAFIIPDRLGLRECVQCVVSGRNEWMTGLRVNIPRRDKVITSW